MSSGVAGGTHKAQERAIGAAPAATSAPSSARLALRGVRGANGETMRLVDVMGLPVVATSQSIGGLLARDGDNILIRDDWDAFADAIVELLSHREQARALGEEGRRTVERHYSWERCAEAFERILESARLS